MTNSSRNDIASDLAYVRSLAEEGAHAPLVGGRHFVVWGGVMAVASIVAYFGMIGILPLSGIGFSVPWIIAGALGWGLSMAMGARERAKPGAMTLGNKTAGAVWTAVGIMMTIIFSAIFLVHDRYTDAGVPAYFMFTMLFPIGFGVYGVAFFATAVAARIDWLKGIAILSWAFAVMSLFMLASPHQFLLGAMGLLVCAVAPGAVLIAREPAELI